MSYEKTKLMNLEDGQTLLGAIDGKMSDLKSAVNNATGNFAQTATVKPRLYIDESGTLVASSVSNRTIVIELLPNKRYKVKKSTSTIMRVGCGASDDLTSGALYSFSKHSTASSDALYANTNDDNYYLYVQLFANSDSASLQSIDANIATLSICEDVSNEIEELKSDFGEMQDAFTERTDVDLTPTGYATLISSTTGKWLSNGSYKSLINSIPTGEKYVEITANSSNLAVFAFLKTNGHSNGDTPDYATGSGRTTLAAGRTSRFAIPDDANYIYILKLSSSGTYTPSSVVYLHYGKDVTIPLGLHELPQSESALNIVKRCRQMTDIKWTPAVDLKRLMLVQRGGVATPDTATDQNYLGTFKAGVEYTGIPYGRVSVTMSEHGYDYATVGRYIDFETFVSSVSNPKSALSEKDVSSVSGHRSVLYATVCSGLTCYALDVSEVPTANIANISGLNLVGKINDNGTLLPDSSFHIGDVLNKASDHTAIITDIIRDNEGVIQFVELSDASTAGLADRNYDDGQIGGLCRRKGWTREQIFDANSWGAYSLYRYSKNVPYTPSKYVNIGDEFNMQRIEHFPIMPYEGEGFIFKTGYIPNDAVKLVITLDGYSFVRVFKDGTEISGSPFTVSTGEDNDINPINVTEIGAGSYTAYLCNMSDGNVTNLTYACHWTVE